MTSVRSRLALALILVLVVSATAAIAAVLVLSGAQQRSSARTEMMQQASASATMLTQQCRALGESAHALALQAHLGDVAAAAQDVARREPGTFAAVVRGGAFVAVAGARPDGLATPQLLGLSCALRQQPVSAPAVPSGPAVIVQTADLTGTAVGGTAVGGTAVGGTAVVGRVFDGADLRALLTVMSAPRGSAVALACPGGRGASSASGHTALLLREAAARGAENVIDGWQVASAPAVPGQVCAVAAGIRMPDTTAVKVAVVLMLVGLLLALVLVPRLADNLTRPIVAVTEAAERVARGDLSSRLPTGGDSELGRLSVAFNHMSSELQLKLGELERSRDLLRQNLRRLADTLQRTHDLDGLLMTVLGAAMSATFARRASVWLVEGGTVVARVSAPAGAPTPASRRLPIGTGLAGEVAVDGVPRRLGHAHQDRTTVLTGPALAAPLRRGSDVLGVIVVEREAQQPAFDTDDEAMLVSLAGPAGIAVDNVLLHREAQRLSVTDPLTGVGNLRHMTTTLAREVERASRFGRPLAVLLLDLDHFKNVNDTLGHTSGDAVLRELADRLCRCVREVDTVARYGGEEFVVIVPETDVAGAENLAERLRAVVRDEPFVVGEALVPVTVSVGIAALPTHARSGSGLVRAADLGLYAAKRSGRDRCEVAPITGVVPAGEDPGDR